MKTFALLAAITGVIPAVIGHYTFPVFLTGSTQSSEWEYVRMTNNYESNNPVTDVTSADLRCYDSAESGIADTVTVAAGSTIGLNANPNMYHPSVVNVYMAQAPSGTDVASWAGDGDVWFKVYEISAVTDGGTSITFPAQNAQGVSFTIPPQLPSGQYIVRVENIALHVAETYGGAQFYIGCANVEVTGGGSSVPGPLVAIPGVYTGYEPGILIDIYYPIPANYTQPGPAVWTGSGSGSTTSTGVSSSSETSSSSSTVKSTSSTIVSSTTTSSASGATQTVYGQCGGTGYSGATVCATGSSCSELNTYYSQCLPA